MPISSPREGAAEVSDLAGDGGALPRITQRSYRPTPYQLTNWEVLGERASEEDFTGMTLEIIPNEKPLTDPMFEQFGVASQFAGFEVWETPGGAAKKKEGQSEPEEPVFDMAKFEAELAAKYEEGFQAGIKKGAAEANKAIEARYQALSSKLSQFTTAVKNELGRYCGTLEQRALELALGVSKKILDTTVEINPEYISDIIRKGLRNLGAAKPVRVRVSPQDLEFLEVVGMPADLTPTELGVQYLADDAIKSGCIIESDFGEVNVELDEMWEQVKKTLYAVNK